MGTIQVKKHFSFPGHKDSIYSLVSLENGDFLSAGAEGMIIRWNSNQDQAGEAVAKVNGSVYAMAYHEASASLYVAENNEGIHLVDMNTRQEKKSVKLGDQQIFDLLISDNRLWGLNSSGELIMLSMELDILERKALSNERARSLVSSPQGLMIGFSDHKILEIDPKTSEITRELIGHKNSVFSLAFHPSQKYLASAGRDATFKVWDANEQYLLRESVNAHLHTINSLVFRADGRLFATGSMDKTIKIWDAHTFQLLKVIDKDRLEGHQNSVNKLLWLQSNDLLVSCSDDRNIAVWDINFEE